MKMINVVRWQIDETNYVDLEGGQVPQRGERVSLHIDGATVNGGWFRVENIEWFVDGETTRGYHRAIAVVYVTRAE
jgi:hypothetical protein